MKAVVAVIVAAAVLLGLGYYFTNASFSKAQPVAAAPSQAPGSGAAQVGTNGLGSGSSANGQNFATDSANLHPEKDGAQFQASGPQNAKSDAVSNAHGNAITFDGAELPQADRLAKQQRALELAKKNAQDRDLKFAPLDDNSDVVGKPYFAHGDSPKHKMVKAHADHINDDLLIMEGRSEDRILTANGGEK